MAPAPAVAFRHPRVEAAHGALELLVRLPVREDDDARGGEELLGASLPIAVRGRLDRADERADRRPPDRAGVVDVELHVGLTVTATPKRKTAQIVAVCSSGQATAPTTRASRQISQSRGLPSE
jgi:hypothetical protein